MALRPLGSRIIVEDITTTLSLEKRGENIGLTIVVNDAERPRNTQGKVLAVGPDPLMQEQIKVGDIVSFGYLSGTFVFVEDVRYRSLEYNEIISVEDAPNASTASNDGDANTVIGNVISAQAPYSFGKVVDREHPTEDAASESGDSDVTEADQRRKKWRRK